MSINLAEKEKKTIGRVILTGVILLAVVICPSAVRIYIAGMAMTNSADGYSVEDIFMMNHGIIYQCAGAVLFAVALMLFIAGICLYRKFMVGTFTSAGIKATAYDIKGRLSRAYKELRTKTEPMEQAVESEK